MGGATGKIKWFSREQQHGVVIGISGAHMFFSCPIAEYGGQAEFLEGQVVGYTQMPTGRVGLRAGSVGPV